MQKNVLIFPSGTEIGLEIWNSLKDVVSINLYGISSVKSNHGRLVFKNYIKENLPNVEEKKFIKKLNYIVTKYKIDFIYPAHDSVLLSLTQNKRKINCKIIASDYKFCKILRDKAKTYDLFKDKINLPKIFQYNEVKKSDFPLFLKPSIGEGSIDTFKVNNFNELKFFYNKIKKPIIMEYLQNKEYTIDCFSDKNKLIFTLPRLRGRIRNGISVESKEVNNQKEFKEIAKKINKLIKFKGVWFFQLRRDKNNQLKLLEISPRVAGTMGFTRNKGVNLALLTYYYFNNEKISSSLTFNNHKLLLDRALFNRYSNNLDYKNVYIDLDDTIIFKNKINPLVMFFIYQCFNESKKIILITKHKSLFNESVNKYLKKNKISDIFDQIINVTVEDEKADYINSNKSIFIDDSFSERLKVFKKLNIPVFDISSLESLINWKK